MFLVTNLMTAVVTAQSLGAEGVAQGAGKFLGAVMKLMAKQTSRGLPVGPLLHDWTQQLLICPSLHLLSSQPRSMH